MNKKVTYILLGVVLLVLIVFGSSMAGKTEEVDQDYDNAYYVEAKGNLVLSLAKIIDKGCFYVVDIVVTGIGSIFNSILGN